MKIIGITGPSGSGKTTLCDLLNKKENVEIVNADKLARSLTLNESEYLEDIKVEFKQDNILNNDGSLNRTKLAEIIYTDNDKLQKLNRITFKHLIPKILEKIKNVDSNIDYVMVDAPLLFEAGLNKYCDYVITLEVSNETRIKRICERDSVSEKIAIQRLKIQKNNDFYRKNSSYVIINDKNTSLDELENQMNDVFEEIEERS